jgi:pilus assembly protein FimV
MPAAAAAAKPAAVATPPALSPAPQGPTKTYSDKPADAATPKAEGWTGSPLDHVDPKQAPAATAPSVIRAEKPVDAAAGLRPLETIPTPAATDAAPVAPSTTAGAAGQTPAATPAPTAAPAQAPTLAPLGPAVEPAPPATSTKDVPAAGTSGRLLKIVPQVDGHTT